MNILVVAHYQGDGSPCASFVHDQAKAYAALGHHVKMVVPIAVGKTGWDKQRFGPILREEAIDGISYHFLRFVSFSRFGEPWINVSNARNSLLLCYSRIFKAFQPDLIHAHTLGFDSTIGAWLKVRLHCPLVVTTHGSDTSIPFEQGKTELLRKLCDQADCVTAVSHSLADKLRACCTATPIQVILNGFQSIHIRTDCLKKPHSMIQVGHLIPSKCVSVTIEAFAALQKRYPDAELTLIGHGPERERLENQAKALGIAGSVRFLGQISNAAVLQEMAGHQFFVMPSVREGFGIVYLEAMASGCVTIGTQGEGIEGFIQDGINGFLVPPNQPTTITEKISWCLEHPNEAAQIAQRGMDAARNQTWEKNAKEYVDLFRTLTGIEKQA